MIEARSDAFSGAIETTAAAIDEAIALRTTEFAATLEAKSGEMSFAIDESTRNLGEALGNQTRQIAERIATRTQQLSDALNFPHPGIRRRAGVSHPAASPKRCSQETATLSARLSTSAPAALNDELETRTMQIARPSTVRAAALEYRMAGAINAVVTTMADQPTAFRLA